ncbi:purine-binding chemotaxis protein CheW [Niastella caeni]|uniref:Purine-binding chemotaxis protein CheW n=1 Tax=Niastella caeni TaxID=2569763 RepID=A0A4S8I3K3_9BACT|nr:chemotaxis protein CheW [Niastella caeni]THU40802.1 purine-binding chemotaxis protein CheW [Niastella caeni]
MNLQQQADSYLTFTLDKELFAIRVNKVLEILEIKPIVKVPMSPAYMRGVINLRGNILPVIDARIKFGMADAPFTINSCIIVVGIGFGKEPLLVGVLVDSVKEVLEIPENAIQPAPAIGAFCNNDLIVGMGKTGNDFAMIVDPDKVFAADELIALAAVN